MTNDDIEAQLGSLEPSALFTTKIGVSNMHCESCAEHIRQTLSNLPLSDISVSLPGDEVIVSHGPAVTAETIVRQLLNDDSIEVYYALAYDEHGKVISEMNLSENEGHSWLDRGPLAIGDTANAQHDTSGKIVARNAKHSLYCTECQQEKRIDDVPKRPCRRSLPGNESDSSGRYDRDSGMFTDGEQRSSITDDAPPKKVFQLIVSIGGMSCSSCSNSIEDGLRELSDIISFAVVLTSNSGNVSFEATDADKDAKIQEIIDCIEDRGFEASVNSVTSQAPEEEADKLFVAKLRITGMTCDSCVRVITSELRRLRYVERIAVGLTGESAEVTFKDPYDQNHVGEIVAKIQGVGFNVSIVDIQNAEAVPNEYKRRTVSLKLKGMFCAHCPEKVADVLHSLAPDDIEITSKPTLSNPIVDVTYTPAVLTVRSLIDAIQKHDPRLEAGIYHPPSVQDISHKITKRETRRYLLRLVFTFIHAIPTFLIGVIFMSAVSPTNHVRRYLDKPAWSGQTTRRDWALLITSTPVMIFGADVFHIRAFKELKYLWHPKSRVPFLKRFYRFGSMNLLISAGTMVAYIPSLAILIEQATTKSATPGEHVQLYFDTVVFLTFFILIGRSLEAYSKGRTGDAVAALGKLRPSEALLLVEKADRVEVNPIHTDYLEIGDIVAVPPGSSPPADGLVIELNGSQTPSTSQCSYSYTFDESSFTGESAPVSKSVGAKVYSGTINTSSHPVHVRITDLDGTSMLDKILSVVRKGQIQRAPVERLAETLTAYFVPVITLIVVLTFIVWQSLAVSGTLPIDYYDMSSTLHPSKGAWVFWALEFAIAVFVVACPCGIGLAAPTALIVGSGMAAKLGILVRGGGEAFQEASRLEAIVFDKTGTLTEGGQMDVSIHNLLDRPYEKLSLALAKELEASISHPIAKAITTFCEKNIGEGAPVVEPLEIDEVRGQGVKGSFRIPVPSEDGSPHATECEAIIGNQAFLESVNGTSISSSLKGLLSLYQSEGRSTAILSLKAASYSAFEPAMIFAISDSIRPEAYDVIPALQSRGISVYMCTGDNQTTANAVAAQLRIPATNVQAGVLPPGKADFINYIREGGSSDSPRLTAFVGDGTNDSPALAVSDVSIALSSGSDVAVSTASFILLNTNLHTVLNLCDLSKRVFRRVKLNFIWAIAYNLCLVPVSAGVFYPIVTGHRTVGDQTLDTHWRLNPVWASLAMALSSVSVVCSSLALKIERKDVKAWVKKLFAVKQ